MSVLLCYTERVKHLIRIMIGLHTESESGEQNLVCSPGLSPTIEPEAAQYRSIGRLIKSGF